jgi:hypothetical protein
MATALPQVAPLRNGLDPAPLIDYIDHVNVKFVEFA